MKKAKGGHHMGIKLNSLFIKMMMTFFLLILPLYGLSVWFTNESSAQMREEIERSNESVLRFHYSNLQFELARMSSMMSEYSIDPELADFSTMSPVMSGYETARRLNNILLKLRQMKSSSNYIEDVSYYIPILNKKVSVLGGISEIADEDWKRLLERAAQQEGSVAAYDGNYYLAKSIPFQFDASKIPNFMLVMQLSEDELVKQLRRLRKEGAGGAYLAFGSSAQTIVSDAAAGHTILPWPGSAHTEGIGHVLRTETEEGYYYTIQDDDRRFQLVSWVTKDTLLAPIRRYSFWMWIFTTISCLLVVVFTYGMYRLIHMPLLRLIKGFKKVESGNLQSPIEQRRGDEFGYLYKQFNKMQRRLHELIQDNYVQRIRTQDAELKHLQSQITPHFLYNSLFTIKQMAELENTEDIKRFSDYLGKYFRFVTRDYNKEVPLSEELEHGLAYLHIQQIRFSNRIRIETEPMPEELQSMLVPRIVLQPILENGFEHGLAQKYSGGLLKLSFKLGSGAVFIRAEDNGEKLTDLQLSELQERLLKTSSLEREGETTGLINVHQRLQIRFGVAYGLTLSRSPLGGLRTEIKLPLPKDG